MFLNQMKGWGVFLYLWAVGVLGACNIEQESSNNALIGLWNAEWQINNDDLSPSKGQLEGTFEFFENGTVQITGFGSPENIVLKDTSSTTFNFIYAGDSIFTKQINDKPSLSYKVVQYHPKHFVLQLCSDVNITLTK